MSAADELFYDPQRTFAAVFADAFIARCLGAVFTCTELNVFIGLLADSGRADAIGPWRDAHRPVCQEPRSHD